MTWIQYDIKEERVMLCNVCVAWISQEREFLLKTLGVEAASPIPEHNSFATFNLQKGASSKPLINTWLLYLQFIWWISQAHVLSSVLEFILTRLTVMPTLHLIHTDFPWSDLTLESRMQWCLLDSGEDFILHPVFLFELPTLVFTLDSMALSGIFLLFFFWAFESGYLILHKFFCLDLLFAQHLLYTFSLYSLFFLLSVFSVICHKVYWMVEECAFGATVRIELWVSVGGGLSRGGSDK